MKSLLIAATLVGAAIAGLILYAQSGSTKSISGHGSNGSLMGAGSRSVHTMG